MRHLVGSNRLARCLAPLSIALLGIVTACDVEVLDEEEYELDEDDGFRGKGTGAGSGSGSGSSSGSAR